MITLDADYIIEVAETAWRKVMQYYENWFHVTTKWDESPVTDADLASNEIIFRWLQRYQKECLLISEETSWESYLRKRYETFFLIDPIDWTKSFVKKSWDFTINIAFLKNNKVLFGLIHHPMRKETYFAVKWSWAYMKNQYWDIHQLNKIPVKEYVCLSGTSKSDYFNRYFDNISPHFPWMKVKIMASSFKYATLAMWKAQMFPCYANIKERDIAPWQILLQEMGGNIVDFAWNELVYAYDDYTLPRFVAYNWQVADKIGEIVAST